MNIYLSCDIEGVNGISAWSETEASHKDYASFKEQMNDEVKKCCKGLNEYGDVEAIYVNDAHDSARNIEHSILPENTILNRNWSRNPQCMVHGIDGGFDASIFMGYHSGGGVEGNSLSHTMNAKKYNYIKCNGEYANEFLLNYYMSLHFGVPVVMVTGDKALCEYVKSIDENIVTVDTKDGVGGCAISRHPKLTNDEIKKATKKALEQIGKTKMDIPKELEFEINFKNVNTAYKAQFYPNAYKISATSVGFKTSNILDFTTFLLFI